MNTNEASKLDNEYLNDPQDTRLNEYQNTATHNPVAPQINQSTMEPAAICSEDVTAALNAILSVDKFAASPQMSAFLKYVVEQTLLGNTRRIKAFTVGLEALGKSASFDPQTDPSVRVLAKRLRSSLDTYYLQHPDTPIIIEMKPGSYVPKFLVRSQSEEQQRESVATISVPATSTLSAPAAVAPSNHNPTHLSINQQSKSREENSANPLDKATGNSNESAETRESSIQRLWKAYKSAPKVAMLITSMGISGWLGVASMTPAMNAQASYQDVNSTADMRLELVRMPENITHK